MVIREHLLPPKFGYVEVEIDGTRKYKNIETGRIIDPNNPSPPTHKEINEMVVEKIREKYDVNEEFKMINLGITNPENEDYVAYRTYVQECVDWGNKLELDSVI